MTGHTYERTMSDLNLAIGYVERLESVSPEQFDRLVLQRQRLIRAVSDLYVFEANHEDAADDGATLGVVGSVA